MHLTPKTDVSKKLQVAGAMFVLPTHLRAAGCSVEVFPSSPPSNALFLKAKALLLGSQVRREVSPNTKSCTPALNIIAWIACLCGGSNKHLQISDVQTGKSEQSLPVQSSVCTEGRNYCEERKVWLTCNHTEHEAKACVARHSVVHLNYIAKGLDVVCLLGAKQEA